MSEKYPQVALEETDGDYNTLHVRRGKYTCSRFKVLNDEKAEIAKAIDATPNDELRELIKEWKAKEDWHSEQSIRDKPQQHSATRNTFRECWQELEQLVGDGDE